MTEPHRDPSLEDLEAVSAHLDGEATAEEQARIDADLALQALAARLAAVRDQLVVADPAESVVDARIATALDAFDRGPSTAPVLSLAAARERRWYHRIPLGAVAAVLVIVALIGAITQIDTDSGDDTATSADAAGDDSGDATEEAAVADDGGDAAGAGGSADLDAPMASTAALEFATVDELAAHLSRDVLAQREQDTVDDAREGGAGPDSGTAPAEPEAACDPVGAAGIEGAPLVAVVPAVVDGRAVTAVVVEGDGGPELVVVDDATCSVTDERPLDG